METNDIENSSDLTDEEAMLEQERQKRFRKVWTDYLIHFEKNKEEYMYIMNTIKPAIDEAKRKSPEKFRTD